MTARRLLPRTRRGWAAAAAIALAAAALVLVGLRGLAATSIGRDIAQARLEALSPRGQTIEIDGLSGDVLGRGGARRLTLRDADGVWLQAENVEFDWSPLSLVRRSVEVSTLSAQTVEVVRRPTLSPAIDRDRAPFVRRYEFTSVRFPNITTSEAVTRTDARFSAQGRVRFGGRAGDIDFSVTPETSSGDQAEIEMAWSPKTPLSGRMRAEGPPGGLIAQALQLDDAAAPLFELTAERVGDETWFDVQLDLSSDPVATLNGALTPGGAHMEGEVDLSKLSQTASLASRVGERASVRIDLVRDRLLAVIDADAATLRASVPFDAERMELAAGVADISADISDLSSVLDRDDVAADGAALKGRATRDDDTWVVVGDVQASGVVAPGVSFADLGGPATMAFDPDERTVSGGVRLKLSGARFDDPRLQRAAGESIDLAVDLEMDPEAGDYRASNARLRGAIGELRGRARYASADGAVSADGAYALTAFGERTGWPIDALLGEWTFLGREGAYNLGVEGRLDALAGATGGGADLFSEGLTYRATADRDAGGAARAMFTIDGAPLVAQGELQLVDDRLSGQGVAQLAELVLGETELSDAQISASVSGDVDRPRFEIDATTEQARFAGEAVEALSVAMQGGWRRGRLSTALRVEGDWRGDRLVNTGDVTLEGAHWRAENVQLDWSGLRIEGVAAGQGADWRAASGDIDIRVLRGSPLARRGRGGVQIQDGRTDANLRLEGLTGDGFDLDVLDFDLQTVGEGARGRLSVEGAVEADGVMQPVALNIDSVLSPAEARGEAVFDMVIARERAASDGPVVFSWSDDGFKASGQADVFGGDVTFGFDEAPEAGALRIEWSNVSAGGVGALFGGRDLEGDLSGVVDLTHQDGRASGRFDAAAVGLGRRTNAARAEARLTGVLADGRVEASFEALDAGDLRVVGAASVPVKALRHPYLQTADLKSRGEVSLTGQGPMDALWALVGPPDVSLEGVFLLDAAYSGRMAQFAPTGRFNLESGVLRDETLGVALEDLAMTATASLTGVSVEHMTARGARGGRVEASGDYAFNGASRVALSLDRLDPFERDDLTLIVSGDLALGPRQGVEGDALLSGALQIEEAVVTSAALPAKSYPTLDVQFDERRANEDKASDSAVFLDIDLRGDRKIYFTGPAFETEWRADINISGPVRRPTFVGDAEILRGGVDFIGRNFNFVDSTVRFAGPADAAVLNLRAEYEASSVTAALEISGPPSAPSFGLSSSPALPDDEILAHVIFGESAANFGAAQAAQIAAAAASLSNGHLGYDFAGSLKSTLGVDRLEFGSTAEGAASLSAGQYVAPDVFVSVKSSARGAPGWGVEWTPWRRLQIDAEREAEDAPRLSVKWRRDFDAFSDLAGVAKDDNRP